MADWINKPPENLSSSILRCVDAETAHEYLVIPVGEEAEVLVVAVEDPDDFAMYDRLRFVLNRELRLVGLARSELIMAVWRFYGAALER